MFVKKAKFVRAVKLTAREKQIVDSFRRAVQAMSTELDFAAVARILRSARSDDFSMAPFISQLGDFVASVRSEAVTSANAAIAGALPTEVNSILSFDRLDPKALAWAEERAGVLISQISDEQREMLRRTIADGISEQITPNELAIRLRSQIGLPTQWATAVERATTKELARLVKTGMSQIKAEEKVDKFAQRYHDKLVRARARNIARTEIVTAQNMGRQLGWIDMVGEGVLSPNAKKTWQVGPSGWAGKSVCNICAPLQGQTVGVLELFSVGVSMPPAHPNCRCTATIKPIKIEDVKELLSYDDEDYRAADELLERAKVSEKILTPLLEQLSIESDGKMIGLEHSLKTRNSLARKINADKLENVGWTAQQAANQINDAVRYTMELPQAKYAGQITDVIQRIQGDGFQIKSVKNFWVPGNDYKGIHLIGIDPRGMPFELQFHTPKSFEIKNLIHPIYEEARLLPLSSAKRKELYQLMIDMSAEQPTPRGVRAIGELKRRKDG